jgi:two-component system, cell cycle sensor histidine kinase and response regulator CckA
MESGLKLAQLQLLYDLAQAVTRADAPDEIYRAAAEGLVRAVACDRASVMIADPDGVMRFRAWKGISDRHRTAIEGKVNWPPGISNRQIVTINDVRQDSIPIPALRPVLEEEGICGLALIPLLGNGGVIGKFVLYYDQPHEFHDEEIQLARTIAAHVAFAAERQIAAAALRESEERLRFAQQVAKIGTFEWNIRTGAITWTPELESMYGLPPGGFPRTVEDFRKLVHPEDRAKVAALHTQSLEAGTLTEGEWRVIRPDGNVVWITGRWQVFKNALGEPARIMGVNIDVTERKRIEQVLQRSEDGFRLAAKATNDGLWDIDLEAGTVSWNETYAAHYGRPPETANSWQWWIDRIHPEDRDFTAGGLRAAVDSGATSWTCEYRFRKPDGKWAYIYDRAYIARDSSGKARRVLGAMQDLTEWKEAEAALRESEKRFRLMADAAPVMIVEADANQSATFFNKAWTTFTGRSLEQELGSGWIDGVHADDVEQCLANISAAYAERRECKVQYRLRRSDGEYRLLLCRGVPHFDVEQRFLGFIASCVDITELQRAQEENVARQKLESVGVLAAGIAHDFNNLLGGILAEAELVETDILGESEAIAEVRKIKILATRASEIVRELMIYAGHETADFEPVDLSQLVIEMAELLKVSISKRAELKTELDRNLCAIEGHPAQLRQVLMNLIINASEAIGDKDGTITVATSQMRWATGRAPDNPSGMRPGEPCVCLLVSDTGRGMTEAERTKTFDPFFTTKFAGRGLGLAVVQGVVRAHRGVIRLVSAPGQGTTFQIFFPAVPVGRRETQVRKQLPAESVSGSTGNILLVEDEEILRVAVAKGLRRSGFEVVEAGDGTKAMDLLRNPRNRFDVILLDLTIPGADSFTIATEVQRLQPETKLVIMSAYSQEAGSRFLRVPQVMAYIRKPFQLDTLVQLLREATNRKARPELAVRKTQA